MEDSLRTPPAKHGVEETLPVTPGACLRPRRVTTQRPPHKTLRKDHETKTVSAPTTRTVQPQCTSSPHSGTCVLLVFPIFFFFFLSFFPSFFFPSFFLSFLSFVPSFSSHPFYLSICSTVSPLFFHPVCHVLFFLAFFVCLSCFSPLFFFLVFSLLFTL